MRKIQVFKILFLICFWTSCGVFIVCYDISLLEFQSGTGAGFNLLRILFVTILSCVSAATMVGILDVFFLSSLLRKKPFGIILVTKSLIYLLFIVSFTTGTELYILSMESSTPAFDNKVYSSVTSYILSFKTVMTVVFWSIATLFAHFVLLVNDKFGQGVLFNFLTGKYHTPKEEERIFMFLDLKSSTSYAENLGHIKYSRLIQDCFFDITEIVIKYDAQIYQYAGDEVILSWNVEKGIKQGNCIKLFMAYRALLKRKNHYYMQEYGVIPEFKSGLHLGKVTIAEVGEIKKELAFHGDAINTAARIQGKCNDFNKALLVSGAVKKQLEDEALFDFEPLGKVVLKGKHQKVNLFSPMTAVSY